MPKKMVIIRFNNSSLLAPKSCSTLPHRDGNWFKPALLVFTKAVPGTISHPHQHCKPLVVRLQLPCQSLSSPLLLKFPQIALFSSSVVPPLVLLQLLTISVLSSLARRLPFSSNPEVACYEPLCHSLGPNPSHPLHPHLHQVPLPLLGDPCNLRLLQPLHLLQTLLSQNLFFCWFISDQVDRYDFVQFSFLLPSPSSLLLAFLLWWIVSLLLLPCLLFLSPFCFHLFLTHSLARSPGIFLISILFLHIHSLLLS